MESTKKGWFDISPELAMQICQVASPSSLGVLIKCTSDPLPDGTTVSHTEVFGRAVRVWLDGAEPRQYHPGLTAYYPRNTASRIVMVDATSRDAALQELSIPRNGAFDGIGTVHSIEAEFVETGRYRVQINYEVA